MAGLIQNAMGSTGYTAATRTLDPNEDTVAGRANEIIKADSPLMQTARTGATQTANKRGLINSSIAAQAGEQAVINAAAPIAQADAGFSNAAKSENMQATNRASEFTAGAGNQFGLTKMQGDQQIAAIGASGAETRKTAELTGAQQLAAIGASGEQARQNIAAQTQGTSQLETQRAQIQQALLTAEGAQKQQLLSQQADIDRQLQELRGTQATALQEQQGQQQVKLQEIKNASDLMLQNVRGDQAERVAQIEGGYRELLQTNASAQQAFTQIAKNISDVMSNANLAPADKQIAVDRNIDILDANLAVLGGITGMDLNSLLTF